MRTVFLLLMAMLVIKTTSAQGQDACSKSYVSCVDKCVSRPSKSLQDTCSEACQTQNNACFSRVLGAPGPTAVTVKEAPAQPAEALAAKDDAPPPAAKPARPTAKTASPAKPPAERKPQ